MLALCVLKVSLGWTPKKSDLCGCKKTCVKKAGYLKEICSRSPRIWRRSAKCGGFGGPFQQSNQGEDSERRKAALKALGEKIFPNKRAKKGQVCTESISFASLKDDSKMLAPHRHATHWGRWI